MHTCGARPSSPTSTGIESWIPGPAGKHEDCLRRASASYPRIRITVRSSEGKVYEGARSAGTQGRGCVLPSHQLTLDPGSLPRSCGAWRVPFILLPSLLVVAETAATSLVKNLIMHFEMLHYNHRLLQVPARLLRLHQISPHLFCCSPYRPRAKRAGADVIILFIFRSTTLRKDVELDCQVFRSSPPRRLLRVSTR